ncbi:MAG TPA: hypothetical protein VLB80_03570 [Candidatus Babeliales bacterium]|nr:hypothetical protein [Candidatus Babeliales bacterium]
MKRIILVLLLSIASYIMPAADQMITLESPVIKIADGTLINADKIEFIRKFRRTLLTFILGDQLSNNQRKGKYLFDGKWHTIESLARIEQETSALINKEKNKETKAKLEEVLAMLEELLVHAKADFIIQSNEFIESGRGAKSVMVVLIQEDCQKRNRHDSLLLEWAKTKEGHESTMFERQITSFGHYYYFLTDLINFLSDLTHSCPKAETQFKDRVAKWGAVKVILPIVLKKVHIKSEQINEVEFLKYLKERYLDSIAMHEIVPDVIVPLLKEYIKHTYSYA